MEQLTADEDDSGHRQRAAHSLATQQLPSDRCQQDGTGNPNEKIGVPHRNRGKGNRTERLRRSQQIAGDQTGGQQQTLCRKP